MLKKILSVALVLALALGVSGFPLLAEDAPSPWAAGEVGQAIAMDLVPPALRSDYTQPETRAGYCALATALYEKCAGGEITERKSFGDTDDLNVEKIAALGLIEGNDEGFFDPEGPLNREQAAVLLSRLAAAVGKPFAKAAAAFSDGGDISDWALAAVGQMQAAGVMGGVGNGKFSPKADFTREQSIITIKRMYDADYWEYYNKRAEAFIESMAKGDFGGAAAMLDEVMLDALPVEVLQNGVWDMITGQAGAYINVLDISNLMVGGYYVCSVTSRHEGSGVIIRIAFSESGLISGLYFDGLLPMATGIVRHEGFTDYPVVIGEGTDYPLDGVLSIPDGLSGPAPAVVLVHGSGSHDYDETIFENKPFRDFAEYLAAKGIAVIRYNKRTLVHGAAMVQQLGGSLTVYEETIEDAILAAEILKADPRIDKDRVFILGHSLGGMLAPRIQAEGGNFAGIISLAGSPRSLLDIMYDQQMAYVEEMPEGDEKALALTQMESYGEQVEALLSLSDDDAKSIPMAGGISAYYYKEMDEHPVSAYIDEISTPFLVLQGSSDFQVYADKDYVMWQDLLAGRTNVTFRLYEGLNHLFMPSAGANITDYQAEYEIPSHVDGQVLADIAAWIQAN